MIGIEALGVPDGPVLFYFHGFPGSRFEARLLARAAESAGVRLIGLDRPGIGLSSRVRHFGLFDWPDDIANLADTLGVLRFSVIGFSGGGPWALACACKIPHRLTGCGVVSCPAEPGMLARLMSKVAPCVFMRVARRRFRDKRTADQSLDRIAHRWPEPDRKSQADPRVRDALATSLVEAYRNGPSPVVREAMLLGGRWDFRLEDIRLAGIRLWHGDRDAQIPLSAPQQCAENPRFPVDDPSGRVAHFRDCQSRK